MRLVSPEGASFPTAAQRPSLRRSNQRLRTAAKHDLRQVFDEPGDVKARETLEYAGLLLIVDDDPLGAGKLARVETGESDVRRASYVALGET